ncbi:MAG: hypothetical protein U5L45_13090 [Saprospiraceae bacterium]|nr:hypothetical protein [Saprospiraceae bacterium]
MVDFSGFARKTNHIPPSRASEASAKRIVWILCMISKCLYVPTH